MRTLLYTTGTSMLVLAGVGIGLFAWLATEWWWYGIGLPLLWFMLAGGWALLAMSAGTLFRLRAGHAVALGGLFGLLVQPFHLDWFALAWAVMAIGGGLLVAHRWPTGADRRGRRAQVKPPLSRRG